MGGDPPTRCGACFPQFIDFPWRCGMKLILTRASSIVVNKSAFESEAQIWPLDSRLRLSSVLLIPLLAQWLQAASEMSQHLILPDHWHRRGVTATSFVARERGDIEILGPQNEGWLRASRTVELKMTEESYILRVIHNYGPDGKDLVLSWNKPFFSCLCWVYLHFPIRPF